MRKPLRLVLDMSTAPRPSKPSGAMLFLVAIRPLALPNGRKRPLRRLVPRPRCLPVRQQQSPRGVLTNPEPSLRAPGELIGTLVINREVSVFRYNSSHSKFAKRLRAETVSQDRVFVAARWAIFLQAAQCSKGSKGVEMFETPVVKTDRSF